MHELADLQDSRRQIGVVAMYKEHHVAPIWRQFAKVRGQLTFERVFATEIGGLFDHKVLAWVRWCIFRPLDLARNMCRWNGNLHRGEVCPLKPGAGKKHARFIGGLPRGRDKDLLLDSALNGFNRHHSFNTDDRLGPSASSQQNRKQKEKASKHVHLCTSIHLQEAA